MNPVAPAPTPGWSEGWEVAHGWLLRAVASSVFWMPQALVRLLVARGPRWPAALAAGGGGGDGGAARRVAVRPGSGSRWPFACPSPF